MRWLVPIVLLLSACSTSDAPLTPAEILADGFVSDAEYLGALAAISSCVEATGAEMRVEFDRNKAACFHLSDPSGSVDLDTVMSSCIAKHLGRAEFVWADQVGPTAEEDAAFYDAVVSCVEEGLGVEFGTVRPKNLGKGPDTSVTDAAIAADPKLYDACFDRQVARQEG